MCGYSKRNGNRKWHYVSHVKHYETINPERIFKKHASVFKIVSKSSQ